jgi:hypothetical protein
MSYSNVAWHANLGFLFTLINRITQFDFLAPLSDLPNGKYLFNSKWSPTDSKLSSLVLANGGSLTFLPNIGSVSLLILVVIFFTFLAPIGIILKRFKVVGAKGTSLVNNFTINGDKLISYWMRIFLEIFMMLYMFLLLGFEMTRQVKG